MTHPICTYCGNPANTLYHVLPQAHYDLLEYPGHEHIAVTVPCCITCNSTAGSKLFESFDKKASYLLNKAIEKKRVQWDALLANLPNVKPLAADAGTMYRIARRKQLKAEAEQLREQIIGHPRPRRGDSRLYGFVETKEGLKRYDFPE